MALLATATGAQIKARQPDQLRPVLEAVGIADRRCQGHGRDVRTEAGDAFQITIFREARGQFLDRLFDMSQFAA